MDIRQANRNIKFLVASGCSCHASGDAGGLSNVIAGNISGTVATATTAGTVTTAAQPNITSVGTLASVTTTGNVRHYSKRCN